MGSCPFLAIVVVVVVVIIIIIFLPGENPWWLKNYKRKLRNLFG